MFWRRRKKFKVVARSVLELKKVRSADTQRNATQQITRLIRNFGELRLSQISELHWNQYVHKENSLKPRTFRDDKTYMRMILLYGVREHLIKRAIRLDIPDLTSSRGREITEAELKRLLSFASAELSLQINIAWKMGLRLREMLRLRWDQIDWGNRMIILTPGDTKTRKKRIVPIPDDIFASLEKRSEISTSPSVFRSPTKTNAPRSSNKTAWVRCKEKADVKARWHDLRHTCCSRLLRNGTPLHIVRAYLGMSEAVANSIYAHVNVDDLRTASNKLSSSL